MELYTELYEQNFAVRGYALNEGKRNNKTKSTNYSNSKTNEIKNEQNRFRLFVTQPLFKLA